ncbi:MAG: hypothetical protein KKA68_21290 [Gammaproteobacteria bacterium]|nr:hypothetical protein [Gammaproteobacteria bacterium]
MSTPPDTIEPVAESTGDEALKEEQFVPTLVQRLLDADVLITDENEAKKKEEADRLAAEEDGKETPEAKPVEKPAGDAPVEKKVDAEGKPIKMRGAKLQRPALKFQEPEKPVPTEKPAAAPPSKPDPNWEKSLEDNEKKALNDARYLEQRFPERYAGMAARQEKFLRDHAKYVEEQGEDFDIESAEYKGFLEKNQPRLTDDEREMVATTRVKDEVNKEWSGKHADLQHKLYARDEEPKVEREVQQIWTELANSALPENVANHLVEMNTKHGAVKGLEEAKKTFGIEIETAQMVLKEATADIKEFLRITRRDPETNRPLAQTASSPADPHYEQHVRLTNVLDSICNDFKEKAPENQQYRNGKWFVTRDEYLRLTPESRAKAWSFTNEEIIAQMKGMAKGAVSNAIKQRLAYIEERGFRRNISGSVQPNNPPRNQTPRTPGGSPVATPAGGGEPPPAINPQVTTILGNLTKG